MVSVANFERIYCLVKLSMCGILLFRRVKAGSTKVGGQLLESEWVRDCHDPAAHENKEKQGRIVGSC